MVNGKPKLQVTAFGQKFETNERDRGAKTLRKISSRPTRASILKRAKRLGGAVTRGGKAVGRGTKRFAKATPGIARRGLKFTQSKEGQQFLRGISSIDTGVRGVRLVKTRPKKRKPKRRKAQRRAAPKARGRQIIINV